MSEYGLQPTVKPEVNWGARIWQWLIRPSASLIDLDKQRQARLMATLSLASLILIGIRLMVGFGTGSYLTDKAFFLYYLFFAVIVGAYGASRTRFLDLSTLLFVLGYASVVYGVVLLRRSEADLSNLNTMLWLLPGFLIGALLFPYWISFVWMVANMVGVVVLPFVAPHVDSSVLNSLLYTLLVLTALTLVLNRYRALVEIDRQGQILAVNRELQNLNATLEVGVLERTRALQVSAEISRRVSTILDLDELVKEVVEEVQEAFGYYHAHIYLFDEERRNLLMVGGTGEAGRIMLANKHQIAAGRGLVGSAAATNQTVLVPNTSDDPNWLPNPLLPDTQAEVAIPIALGDTTLGVLDVQHNIADGLKQEDADLLQAIANQVAVAVQNARQYAQAQESEGRMRAMIDAIPTAVLITRISDGIVQYANDKAAALFGYSVDNFIGNLTPNLYYNQSDRETILNILRIDGTVSNYEVLGRRLDGSAMWVALSVQTMIYAHEPSYFVNATDITERRQATEMIAKRAERDRVLNRLSTKIRSAVTAEQVLQIAAQETRQAIQGSHLVIQITPNQQPDKVQQG